MSGVSPLIILGVLAAGTLYLLGRRRRRASTRPGRGGASSGLAPVADLTHLPASLQNTALWSLADGGFERRVVHGVLTRGATDVDVTAFDLETLRERRGEWAWLPVEPPFRIGGVVSVVVCELDRAFPHVLLKRVGHGDELSDDNLIERAASVTKVARDGLGLARATRPSCRHLPPQPLALALPDGWRAYTPDPRSLAVLLDGGFAATLQQAGRRDLVVELIGVARRRLSGCARRRRRGCVRRPDRDRAAGRRRLDRRGAGADTPRRRADTDTAVVKPRFRRDARRVSPLGA